MFVDWKTMKLGVPAKGFRWATLAIVGLTLGVLWAAVERTDAQQPAPAAPKATTSKVLIDPTDTVILLLDHQNGLFQTVKDVPVAERDLSAGAGRRGVRSDDERQGTLSSRPDHENLNRERPNTG
jgi:hypothetical protein